MGARMRRATAGVALLVFLALYIWAAIAIADRLPDIWWVDLLFFAIVGTAWGAPLGPLFSWAEGGPKER